MANTTPSNWVCLKGEKRILMWHPKGDKGPLKSMLLRISMGHINCAQFMNTCYCWQHQNVLTSKKAMPQTETAIKWMMSEDDFCIFENDACFLSHFLFSKKRASTKKPFSQSICHLYLCLWRQCYRHISIPWAQKIWMIFLQNWSTDWFATS